MKTADANKATMGCALMEMETADFGPDGSFARSGGLFEHARLRWTPPRQSHKTGDVESSSKASIRRRVQGGNMDRLSITRRSEKAFAPPHRLSTHLSA